MSEITANSFRFINIKKKKSFLFPISRVLLRFAIVDNCATEEEFMRKVNPHQKSGGKEILSSAK